MEIEDAILRATPLKKREERVVFGNVPFFVENGDLVAALRPYGQITSIVQKMLELGNAYWADAGREAFITLRDGVKLSLIPVRLEIKSKGVTSHVYVTYGIRQPSSSNAIQALSPTTPADPPSTAAPTSAASSALLAAPPPAAQTQTTASVGPSPPPPRLSSGVKKSKISSRDIPNLALENPKASSSPDEIKKEETLVSSPLGTPSKTRGQINDLLERVPNDILDRLDFKGLEKSDILEALVTVPGLKKLQKKMRDEQKTALTRVAEMLVEALPNSNSAIYKRLMAVQLCHFLRQHRVDVAFIQNTNVTSLDSIQHLCLGYSAVIVPPAALRGSGLACLFDPGVAVLWQRVLWPSNISIVSIDVRGQEVRVINCHLTHIPRVRLEQLESIKAAAIQMDAWVVGDLNIHDQSTSDTASGSVEALTELMEQTALVDASSYTAHLDRIILLSRLLERVTLYKAIYYRFSDHRAVLVHLGPPPFPRQPCVAAMLRSVLVDEYLLATIERTAEYIADMTSEALWIRWSNIKAELLTEVRSLHVSSVADDDHISRAGRFLQARLEAASSAADYPSLPDLVRSLRVRRPASTTIRDEDVSIIEGGELRRRTYSIYQRRFARESSDPIAATEFIRGTTTPLTLEEDDPLIALALGWDDLPSEFLIAYEDFFIEALRRVFEASKLRGTLPSLIRRSTICLVPKSNAALGSAPTGRFRSTRQTTASWATSSSSVCGPISPQRDPHGYEEWVGAGCNLYGPRVGLRHPGPKLSSVPDDLLAAATSLHECFLLLYAGVDAAVRPGGLHTRLFHLLNGVRQGCAVSGALFSLATGPLLVRLERALGSGNVLAYADDIVLLIRRDEPFDVVRNIFEDFRRASRIDVNFAKSRGLWCGAWRARTDTQLGISWTSEQLRVLSCNATSAMSSSAQEQHLLALLEGAITRWVPFTPGLSLVGRARAANLLVLSAVVHHLHGYLPTDSTTAKLQARLGVQAALRGSLNAYSWLAVSGTWLSPPTSETWLPPLRRRLLRLWEAVSEILELNHRVLPPHQLQELHVIGDCKFFRSPDLLVASRWAGLRVGDITSSSSLPLRTTRATLADVAVLTTFCSRLLLGRWIPHVCIPISISWSSLRRGAYSGHNADVAARLVLHALPHPALPASARESCIVCGYGDLSLAHRYWSCRRIRPVIVEAFTIIQALGSGNVLVYADDTVLLIRRDEALRRGEKHLRGLSVRLQNRRQLREEQMPMVRRLASPHRHAAWHLLDIGAASGTGLQCNICNVIFRPGTTSSRTARECCGEGSSAYCLAALDIGTQLRLECLKGVQAALRGSLNAYSWLAVSGTWLSPPTSETWLPPLRRRLLRLWEAVSEILELNHRVLPPHQLQELHVIGDCKFFRSPDLLVASRWAGLCVGDITSSSSLPLRTTRATLADVAVLTTFCSRLVEQNRNHTHRVDNIENAIVLRGTATPLQRLTTRTARRMLERPGLAALPITQLLGPVAPSRAYSGHNADVAARLALHALPHPALPASARESCIVCGSGDLSLAHRYWSCRRIRPVIVEAFTIIQ
ncbi:hypothetical protein LAZ67_13000854 [Cordylochernes scorpioides]|uniref:Reverse transcriptase domain-containing protein n=1 Tax=Cordylochernes scorpioides TaxID=51811 RepID=A0ABY6L3C8_9ARAC|nr:hypothetical protein LAZ67_13000854 [Cordylochernes scorpioides]